MCQHSNEKSVLFLGIKPSIYIKLDDTETASIDTTPVSIDTTPVSIDTTPMSLSACILQIQESFQDRFPSFKFGSVLNRWLEMPEL